MDKISPLTLKPRVYFIPKALCCPLFKTASNISHEKSQNSYEKEAIDNQNFFFSPSVCRRSGITWNLYALKIMLLLLKK